MTGVQRQDIRNIAIIAHVDHGKTTLVDAMLKQTRVSRDIEELGERIMDSMDLERERGITIRAKNASIIYNGVKINLVDTPGHADFGGEVERTLRMADGVLLLVDAKEGPMPQTKFVLRKALALGYPAIVVINKIDRKDAQIDDAVNRTFDLFIELGATDEQLDFSIVYTSAINGTATLELKQPGKDLVPLFETILKKIPAPLVNPDNPLQILVLALTYDYYKGKMGVGKILSGSITKKQPLVQIKTDGTHLIGKATDILVFKGLERVEVERADAGEIVAVAGLPDIGIGETIADPGHRVALPPVLIEEPIVRMTFSVNNSPLSGQEGKYVTSRNLRERLFKELETNVSLRVKETDSPDTFLVAGRGELHLAVLIETMRREGYELQVSQPEVIMREADGVKMEPYEQLTIDLPQEYQGSVMEAVGRRRGELKNMTLSATGELHLEYSIPTRGTIGLKNILMTKTKGTVIINHVFDSYKPAVSQEEGISSHGSLVASNDGVSTTYGLNNAQERGRLFIGPGAEVYQGMIIGQNARNEDIEVNPCKTKHATNVRSSTSDEAIILTPPLESTLEFALEYIGPDELVEVTPSNIRLRKKVLDPSERRRARRDAEKNKKGQLVMPKAVARGRP